MPRSLTLSRRRNEGGGLVAVRPKQHGVTVVATNRAMVGREDPDVLYRIGKRDVAQTRNESSRLNEAARSLAAWCCTCI